jgi:hypothetical protein
VFSEFQERNSRWSAEKNIKVFVAREKREKQIR